MERAQQRPSKQTSTVALLAGWFVGPLAWALHENVSYYVVFWACGNDREWLLHLVTLTALAASLGALLLSWGSWRAARAVQQSGAVGSPDPSRVGFLALGGILLSGLSTLGIAMTGAMVFILSPCVVAT